jgi:arginyl-tRNA synthetase
MVFNPEESIDFHGFTGPFIQYTHARIKSILRKMNVDASTIIEIPTATISLLPLEKGLAIELEQFTAVLKDAANEQDPSKVAIYIYNLAKVFSSFYNEHSIANAENDEKKNLRLMLAISTAQVIKTGMNVLGIKVPERM